MKVAMLISYFPPAVGGTERQAWNLARELARNGTTVTVVTQRFQPDLKSEETLEGVTIYRLPPAANTPLASFWFLLRGLWFLRKREPRPDILHAHMIAVPAVLACLAGMMLHRKTLVKVACAGPYGDIATSQQTWLRRLKLRFVLGTADRLVCLTPEIEHEVMAAGGNSSQIARIPNGVDTQRFRPVVSDEEKESMRWALQWPKGRWIVFSGRLTAQKRPDVLLEAFKQCQAAIPDAYLAICGEGPLKETLQKQIERENLAGRVFLRGNQNDMEAIYKNADVFILPSAAEGLSNSLLEAMATGLPCIATHEGGAGLITDQQNGRVVPLDQPGPLARAIQDVLQDKTLARKLGEAARQTIVDKYRVEAIAQKYMTLYQEMLN